MIIPVGHIASCSELLNSPSWVSEEPQVQRLQDGTFNLLCSSFCVITLNEDALTHCNLCQKSKHWLRFLFSHFLIVQSLDTFTSKVTWITSYTFCFSKCVFFCPITIVDSLQVFATLPSACRSPDTLLLPKPSLSPQPAECLFCNAALTIALHWFAQHLSVAYY